MIESAIILLSVLPVLAGLLVLLRILCWFEGLRKARALRLATEREAQRAKAEYDSQWITVCRWSECGRFKFRVRIPRPVKDDMPIESADFEIPSILKKQPTQ